MLALGYALFEGDRDVAPYLNCQDNSSREQQCANGYMRYGCGHHGQLGLRRIPAPGDTSQKRGEAEAKLRDE